MDRKTDKCREAIQKRVVANDTPAEESFLIRQRLRDLCELAVSIGQKEGLFGNQKETDTRRSERGQDINAKENIQDYQTKT